MTDAGPDEAMSDLDALIWAVDHDPRNRTTIAVVAHLDGSLDIAALTHRLERASRSIPRLRQHVVTDPRGFGSARWAIDPAFAVERHLRVERFDEPDPTALLDRIRDLVVEPFDRNRPLWELAVLEGQAAGSAVVFKAHHAVSDGVGGVRMLAELFDLEPTPDADRTGLPPLPGTDVKNVRDATAESPRPHAARVLRRSLTGLERFLDRLAADPAAEARRAGETLGAAYRMVRPLGGDPPLPGTRSAGLDLRSFTVDLDDLRAAGRRIGGTVNTAFVTAVALGIGDHGRLRGDVPLRISVPVSVRDEGAAAGNHWRPSRVDIRVAAGAEPDATASAVRRACAGLRDDPVHAVLPALAGGLRALPAPATAALFGSLTSAVDVAASNVPGSPVPLFLCGRPVRSLVPFGPLSGAAVNVTLLSYAGAAAVGISSDPAAIDEPDRLRRDLEQAFTAVSKGC